jgi:hypothetical protein
MSPLINMTPFAGEVLVCIAPLPERAEWLGA